MKLVADLFAGRKPLWFTFWVAGVLGSFLFKLCARLVLGLSLSFLLPVDMPHRESIAFALLFALSLLYDSFICIAVWRSAGAYTGWLLWKILARLLAFLGLVQLLLMLMGIPGRDG